mmetsp:Transcript_15779/g.20590  ORF Transcript_15779/g.20590 Transcript_15779/m.20590 type:complete len:185 (-) Transcript_15779:182-736(-)
MFGVQQIGRRIVSGSWPRALRVTIGSHCRSFVSATAILLDKRTVMVPTMGDSITEGTIVEWTVQVGQAVQVDDVVAMIETDKVTVDIKAEVDGVVTQQFSKIDETVEVGASPYEIDSDAEATVDASPSTASSTTAESEPSSKEPVTAAVESKPTPTPTQKKTRAGTIDQIFGQGGLGSSFSWNT